MSIFKDAAVHYANEALDAKRLARTEADRADRWRAVAGVLTLVVCVLVLVCAGVVG